MRLPAEWAIRLACAATLALGTPAAGRQPDSVRPPAFGEFRYFEKLPEVVRKAECALPSGGRASGVVLIHALVDTAGRVRDTRVTRSLPGLDEAAVACVRQWVFRPALADGKPVAVWVAIPVRFRPSLPPAPPGAEADLERFHLLGPRIPAAEDFALVERIIRRALAASPPLAPADSASFLVGSGNETLRQRFDPQSAADALQQFEWAIYEAPWWGEAYRGAADALERLGRAEDAARCLELALLCEPEAPDREVVRKSIRRLRAEGDPSSPRRRPLQHESD